MMQINLILVGILTFDPFFLNSAAFNFTDQNVQNSEDNCWFVTFWDFNFRKINDSF